MSRTGVSEPDAACRAVAALFSPDGVDSFRREVFGRRAIHMAPRGERLAAFRGLTTWSVDALLSAHRGDATAWFESRSGRHTTAEVSTTAARRLYAGGSTIYLREVALLAPLAGAIADALAAPPANILCAVFCNQPGAHTQLHFDPVDTISVQITGSKTWWVAPNEHASNPTSTWLPDEPNPSPELAHYAETPMPTTRPETAREYRLTPGAVLYVPRGHWHETHSDEESISLHVHHVTTPWLDVLLATLRARLLREAPLRGGADDLWDPAHRSETLTTAAAALATLAAAVSELAPEDLVPSAPVSGVDAAVELVRRATAGLRVEQLPGTGVIATVVVDEYGVHRETAIEMSDRHLAACRYLAQATTAEPVTPGMIAARCGLDLEQAVELSRLLVDTGYLRPASKDLTRRQAA
jgi:hypothetical protein